MLCRFSAGLQVQLWHQPPLPVVARTAAEVKKRFSDSFLPCGCLRSWIGGRRTFLQIKATSLAASLLSPMDNVYLLKTAASAVTQHFQFGYILWVPSGSSNKKLPPTYES